MNNMNKFNEVYKEIISEGILRKVGQAFKSKKAISSMLFINSTVSSPKAVYNY